MAHKTVVLRCLEAICDNGQLLVDIFVNYDCDLEGANLFERLVNALVRIAQGNQDKEAQASVQPDEQRLRINVRFSLAAFLFCSMTWQVCPCLSAYNAEPFINMKAVMRSQHVCDSYDQFPLECQPLVLNCQPNSKSIFGHVSKKGTIAVSLWVWTNSDSGSEHDSSPSRSNESRDTGSTQERTISSVGRGTEGICTLINLSGMSVLMTCDVL